MKRLNNKEIKKIYKKLEEQFKIKNLKLDYLFFSNKDNKIFIINKDLQKINLNNFNINSYGLYFGKIENNGIRLSLSATHLIGNNVSKNILEIDKKEEWLNGQNLECDKSLKGWFIIKDKEDFLGCGYCKEGILLNFIPKKK